MAKRNIFRGADDIYLTKKRIAVRRVATKRDAQGNQVYSDRTVYVPKTAKNLERARSIHGKIRYGRK